MSAHVAEEAALADGAAASRAGEGVLKLRRVLLSPSDEQKVFELGVRLSYADQPALLLAALTELREAVLADLPPQALLQRPRAVDATIALARAVDGPTAMSRVAETRTSGDTRYQTRDDDAVTPAAVRTAALVTLRAFCEALKGALGHAADGAHKVAPPPTRADAPEHVLPSSQLASRSALSYPPPAGGLAAFARFAPEPNAVPAAARHALGAPMPTLPAAHRIALAVAPALASPAAAGDALGVLESVSPLLELSAFVDGHEALAEEARESESLDADALDALASRRASDAASRLGAYLHAAESALERASRNASPDGTDDALPKGECPVFFPALALAAVLIAAAGPEAAREADAAGGVPARLVERLSTAAIDELLAAAVPGLRAAALAALAALGDDTARSECAAAEAADLGMQAAETAASDDAEAAANRAPHAAARLALAALPALEHLAEDEAEPLAARLVATVLTSAASATAAADFEAFQSDAERVATENWLQRGIQDVRDATRRLLGTESSVAARRGAYAALAAAAEISLVSPDDHLNGREYDEYGREVDKPDAAARAVSAAARAVMLGADVVGEIVAGGLSDASVRVYAAKCLNCIAAGAGASSEEAAAAAAALLPWLPWLECDLDDETAGPAVSAAAAAAVRAAPAEKWSPIEPLLRGLFHRAPRRRAAAAEGLARALGLTPDLPAPAQMDATASLPESARAWIDPFGGALRHADYARRVGSEAEALASPPLLESYAETYVAPGRPSVLASVFEPEDARELFGVLAGDARLGPSVRCAAADQLCVCAADERLESEMIRPTHLASVARLAASAAVTEGPDLDVASASLKLLAAVVSRSRRARAFFSDAAPAVELDYNDLRDGAIRTANRRRRRTGAPRTCIPARVPPAPVRAQRFAVFGGVRRVRRRRVFGGGEGARLDTRASPRRLTLFRRVGGALSAAGARRRRPRSTSRRQATRKRNSLGRATARGRFGDDSPSGAEGSRDARAETRDAPAGGAAGALGRARAAPCTRPPSRRGARCGKGVRVRRETTSVPSVPTRRVPGVDSRSRASPTRNCDGPHRRRRR
jgi:rotatin